MNPPVVLQLPFPPSVNALWRFVGMGKVKLSHEARKYRHDGLKVLNGQEWQPFGAEARLKVALKIVEPDAPHWRGVDLDNHSKAVLDLLQQGGVIVNDAQFDRVTLIRGGRSGTGYVLVHIAELDTG
ncbi:hypothetical protein Dxin01_01328 [Deinococcus xinjiangensis]|uniref:Crossover junction endodeoxyribonuclease RusA n=1 Tax=Deinococcus xinjiangensis TaxID=457454 RepID=A0ABP9VD05_9DEIO